MLSHAYCQSVDTLSQTSVKPKACDVSANNTMATAMRRQCT